LGVACCPNASPKCQQLNGLSWTCYDNGLNVSLPFGYCVPCGGSGGVCCTDTTPCQSGTCLANGSCP
jgi:hypothetical protein